MYYGEDSIAAEPRPSSRPMCSRTRGRPTPHPQYAGAGLGGVLASSSGSEPTGDYCADASAGASWRVAARRATSECPTTQASAVILCPARGLDSNQAWSSRSAPRARGSPTGHSRDRGCRIRRRTTLMRGMLKAPSGKTASLIMRMSGIAKWKGASVMLICQLMSRLTPTGHVTARPNCTDHGPHSLTIGTCRDYRSRPTRGVPSLFGCLPRRET